MTIQRTAVPFVPLFSLLLLILPFPASAAVITFDFLDLVESQSSPISGVMADGSPWSGPAQAGAYQSFSWEQQGITVTTTAQWWQDNEYAESELLPSYVYLQPFYAGLGACQATDCSSALLGYLDHLTLRFDQQVELIGIRFTTGEDPWEYPPEDDASDDEEPSGEQEDYRAYNMRIDMSGGAAGPQVTEMNSRETWSGSLTGDQLILTRSEGTGAYVGSITVRTVEVPEPGSLSLLALAFVLGWWGRRHVHTR